MKDRVFICDMCGTGASHYHEGFGGIRIISVQQAIKEGLVPADTNRSSWWAK